MEITSPSTPKPVSSQGLRPECARLPATPQRARHLRRGRMGGMKLTRGHRRNGSENGRSAFPGGAAVPSRNVPVAIAACLAAAVALTACTGGAQPLPAESAAAPAGTSPAAPESPATAPTPAEATAPANIPATAEDPATAALKQTVTDVLGRLAAGTPRPATAQVIDALTGAGIVAATLEVSESRTPTGLEADAIEAAVLQGGNCIIGQVRDGGVSVTVLPVLASGKCFVGSAA